MSAPEQAPDAAVRPDDHDDAAWREGVKAGLPTLFGIGAWGLVVGIAMVKTGLTVPQAIGMTLLVFAGSAQLASLPLIANSAALCGVLMAGAVAVLANAMPYKLGLLLAVVLGMVTAMVVEETLDKRKSKP